MFDDEMQSQTVEENTSTKIPQNAPNHSFYDDEAEERKEQVKSTLHESIQVSDQASKQVVTQTVTPTPDHVPATEFSKDNTVNIENMFFFNDGFEPNHPAGAYQPNYVISAEQLNAINQKAAQLKMEQNAIAHQKQQLDSLQNQLSVREQRIAEEESRLKTWDQSLRNRENQLNFQMEAQRNSAIEQGKHIIAQAEQDAMARRKQILDARVDEEVQKLVQQHLRSYFDENAVKEDEFRRSINDDLAKTAHSHANLINQMDGSAKYIQNTLNQTIAETLKQIQSIRENMVMELDSWRRQLYKTQYRDFGACFANLDKLTNGMELRLAKELAEGDHGYHPELAEELKRYIKNMKALRNAFERSLSNLGIRAFYPDPGTPFNSRFHTMETLDPMNQTDDDFNDMPITACSKPGLLRITEAGEEPLLNAVVTVNTNY